MERSFECLFIDCLQSLIEHWSFVTEKRIIFVAERAGASMQDRTQLKDTAEKLGRAVAVSFTALIGTSVRCSYLHAFVYAFPPMIYELWHILRASMEGFEHGNKLMKAIYLRRTSAGGKLNQQGFRLHRQAQALERRREATVAAHELGMINRHASLRQFLKPERLYIKRFDVTELKEQLILKREDLFLGSAECGICEEQDNANS
eukprot:4454343-Pleurochrysis_carterae.AAC.1